jgi:hypothetical protein
MFRSRSELRHELPTPTAILSPARDARGLPATGLRIAWTPTKDAVHYLVELEEEESQLQFTATMPSSAASFSPPADLLSPGREYSLAVGTVGRNGNISYIETSFRTAPRK